MTSYYSDQAVYIVKKKKQKILVPIFIIIAVIVIIMPIYGTTLRYQVSISIRLICDYLGNIFQQVGWLLLGLVVAKVLLGRKIDLNWMIVGILLLYVGAFLTGGTVSILGLTVYEPTSTPGFH